MESRKLLPAIVAMLMITTILSISTTAVATHVPSVEITPKFVKQDISKVYTLKVTNTSGDSINKVKITLPSGFSGLASVAKVPKDNLLNCVDDNDVILPAGTIVKLATAENVTLYENTDVIRENNTWVWVPALGENALLRDNALVEVTAPVNTRDGIPVGDNVAPAKDTTVTLTAENTLRLLQDTLVVRVGGNVVKLPEDTLLEVTSDRITENDLAAGDNITLKNDRRVKLADNVVRTVASVPVLRGGAVEATLGAGVTVQLISTVDPGTENDNLVIIPSGTKVKLLTVASVTLPENTDVKRASGKRMELVTPAAAEDQPVGWTFDGTDTWSTDNTARMIASGASLIFPYAVDVGHFGTPGGPVKPDDYVTVTWAVSTWDTTGARADKSYDTIVDYKWPTIFRIYSNDVYYYPKLKAGTTVRVKVSTSWYEVVSGMSENSVAITVVSTDNIVEYLTMTTTDNLDWLGSFVVKPEWERKVTNIVVVENTLVDRAGNTGPLTRWTTAGSGSRFYVDNTPPLKPQDLLFSGLANLPEKDNQASWLVTGRCEDNDNAYTPDTLTAVVEVNGIPVRKTVGKGVSPYYTFSIPITLSEGNNTVKVWVEDFVGWVGEAVENRIFLDTKSPTVEVVSIAGKAFVENMAVNDNKPKIVVKMLDPGYAENKGLGVNFPDNVTIKILYDNGSVVAPLENSNVWDVATGIFENTPAALADNWYRINVSAGDNLNALTVENFRFEVDTTPPALPSAPAVAIPERTKVASVTVAGTAEARAKIKIYVMQNTTVVRTEETTADELGNFSLKVTLPEGTSRIEVSATDRAGNEGPKRLYGTVTVDSTVPTISIISPADKTITDQASIAIVCKVSEEAKWTVVAPAGSWTGKTDADGNFSLSIALVEGTNTIIVTAEDDVGNVSAPKSIEVTRTVTAWGTYAIILVIVALILAAIAIFRKK
ncbi:MAG: Ig-like domain-containing protein [Candidatus Hodarchaeaceae archaeon]|nr:Ig-like domain-containing protein [Candidatus Hodarchaeaceae archaeon]